MLHVMLDLMKLMESSIYMYERMRVATDEKITNERKNKGFYS